MKGEVFYFRRISWFRLATRALCLTLICITVMVMSRRLSLYRRSSRTITKVQVCVRLENAVEAPTGI